MTGGFSMVYGWIWRLMMGFWARLLNRLFSLNIADYKEYLFNNPHMAIAILDTDFNFLAVN